MRNGGGGGGEEEGRIDQCQEALEFATFETHCLQYFKI